MTTFADKVVKETYKKELKKLLEEAPQWKAVLGRYEFIEKLGEGSFGTVIRARDNMK